MRLPRYCGADIKVEERLDRTKQRIQKQAFSFETEVQSNSGEK